jgi:hypothetical protein
MHRLISDNKLFIAAIAVVGLLGAAAFGAAAGASGGGDDDSGAVAMNRENR